MLELFELGEHFLNALKPIGDWLMRPIGNPLPSAAEDWLTLFAKMSPPDQPVGADLILQTAESFEGTSIATVIFGSALVGVLGFKLVKFFTKLFS